MAVDLTEIDPTLGYAANPIKSAMDPPHTKQILHQRSTSAPPLPFLQYTPTSATIENMRGNEKQVLAPCFSSCFKFCLTPTNPPHQKIRSYSSLISTRESLCQVISTPWTSFDVSCPSIMHMSALSSSSMLLTFLHTASSHFYIPSISQ